jgi:hypothetical protein
LYFLLSRAVKLRLGAQIPPLTLPVLNLVTPVKLRVGAQIPRLMLPVLNLVTLAAVSKSHKAKVPHRSVPHAFY